MEQKTYTISIYAENNVGLLSRVSAIFLKRHINIDSLNISLSEIDKVSRFVIVVRVTEVQVQKIVKQIEKQIEVIKAFYHTDEETIFQESALYKVSSKSLFEERHIQNVIKKSHANIVTIYDVGEEGDLGYIAMDLLTGAPLSEFVKPENRLPAPFIYQLMIQCVHFMNYRVGI